MSPLYRLMLYSAILPSTYCILMVAGKLRRAHGLTLLQVVFRALGSWMLIMGIYILCGLLIRFTMGDLSSFMDARIGRSPFVRFYPVAVFIIAMAGLWYPRADFFNRRPTRQKKALLFVVCFTPLYLMLIYMLFVEANHWRLCLSFGFRSSMLAFTIAFPVIFLNAPDSLRLLLQYVIMYLFCSSSAKPK